MNEFRGQVAVGKETVVVVIRRARFDARQHRFTPDKRGVMMMDGVYAVGADGFAADPEERQRYTRDDTILTDLQVTWNGQRIRVPKTVYRSVLSPDLTPRDTSDSKGSVYLVPGRDNQSVLIGLKGSDGVGGYNAWFTVCKNGEL